MTPVSPPMVRIQMNARSDLPPHTPGSQRSHLTHRMRSLREWQTLVQYFPEMRSFDGARDASLTGVDEEVPRELADRLRKEFEDPRHEAAKQVARYWTFSIHG